MPPPFAPPSMKHIADTVENVPEASVLQNTSTTAALVKCYRYGFAGPIQLAPLQITPLNPHRSLSTRQPGLFFQKANVMTSTLTSKYSVTYHSS